MKNKINKRRATGRTTNLVNYAVKDLFKNGIAYINDHYWKGKEELPLREQNQHIINVFLRRLESEHRLTSKDLIIDRTGVVELRDKSKCKTINKSNEI